MPLQSCFLVTISDTEDDDDGVDSVGETRPEA